MIIKMGGSRMREQQETRLLLVGDQGNQVSGADITNLGIQGEKNRGSCNYHSESCSAHLGFAHANFSS